MFAYTGLKPEQMEALVKEVSTLPSLCPPTLAKHILANHSRYLALCLRHQGRPYLRGRYHLGQRQASRQLHLQDHWLNISVSVSVSISISILSIKSLNQRGPRYKYFRSYAPSHA